MLALFRIVELTDGKIEIDGIDISKIGLKDLRTKLSIIPQDPTLFEGTVKSNLDPYSESSEMDIWSVLDSIHLRDVVEALPEKLDAPVQEFGENFSAGQRQLMCLGRALLRRSKILLLDEATSAVDFHTDSLIQQTIRKEFANATVLTIAHRIHTIMDYDRVIVLDDGDVAEFDSPSTLVKKEGSIFRSMTLTSGTTIVDIDFYMSNNLLSYLHKLNAFSHQYPAIPIQQNKKLWL